MGVRGTILYRSLKYITVVCSCEAAEYHSEYVATSEKLMIWVTRIPLFWVWRQPLTTPWNLASGHDFIDIHIELNTAQGCQDLWTQAQQGKLWPSATALNKTLPQMGMTRERKYAGNWRRKRLLISVTSACGRQVSWVLRIQLIDCYP